jgi:DNA repair protein RecO (recombination protein O)
MYQKYQSDAVVLGSREQGESDKSYAFYTKDFGLVRARASAVRTEQSKMRYALQSFSIINISLVRGKRGWRAAGARAVAPAPIKGVHAFARAAELVTRLIPGEEKNDYLFEVLVKAHEALSGDSDVAIIEILCVVRVLYTLGYISAEALQSDLFETAEYGEAELAEAARGREKLLAAINRALQETHL